MCRNTSSFVAILVSLLASRDGRCGVFVQAFSTPHPLQIKHAPSQHTFDVFFQVGGIAPVDKYNGVAFLSGETGPGGMNNYDKLRQKMRKRWEENERRQRQWEKENAAGDAVTAIPNRYGPSHPLHKHYAEERMRQHVERQKLLAAQRAEEREDAEAEDTTVVYKNTIRACLESGQIDRQKFCEQAGSVLECEELLDALQRTNSFMHLKFDPLTYKVNSRGKTFSASVLLFHTHVLQFLAQLNHALSQTCNYDVKTIYLVRSCFEDAINSTSAGEKVWDLSRSRERSVLGLPITALKKAFSKPVRHHRQLYELALILTTTLVKAGSLYRTFPLLSRFFNFACRSRRLCVYGIREVMTKYLYTLRGAAVDTSVESSPQLTEKLRKTLSALFKGSRERIAKNGAVVLSAWLTQSTAAILEAQSSADDGGGGTM